MAIINPKNVELSFDKIERIIHISDVHVRLYRRHKEYRQVFKKLFSDIRSHKFKNTVIAVTGDIHHAKTDLSPEMVQLVSEFLLRLARLHPTIVTLGNHDLNLANSHRLDSLTPILKNIQHPNLYYLRESGVYTFANTDFAVLSVVGEMVEWPTAADCTSENKVALCHAPVNNAETDTGFTITSRHIDITTFDGYDMVLLGDIHKRQILQEYDAKNHKPLIAYAGSLIQQNHGEKIAGHGWLEWDVANRSIKEHDTYNEYGYATIVVDTDGVLPDLSAIPPRARLRVFVRELEASKIKKLEAILKKKFKLQEFTVNKMRDMSVTLDNQKHAAQSVDVQDIEVQNKLIADYLDRHHGLAGSDTLKRIFEINKRINAHLEPEDFSRNIFWKPIRFEFSNILSYGEDNVIDFDSMQGVYGLFSPNASGKTAAFDALTFCLFDKTPRAFKGSHIMNNRKNKFRSHLQFEINGQEFGIERVGKRKRDGEVKVDVEFWRMEEGKKISLNAEDRRSTNAQIRKYVGTYEDFILTSFSVQNNNSLFIDKSQSERKDLLSQFMGINIFDSLYTLALDEMKGNLGALKVLRKTDLAQELIDTQNEITSIKMEYKSASSDVEHKEHEIRSAETQIQDLYDQKIPLSIGNVKLNELEAKRKDLTESVDGLSELSIELEGDMQSLTATSGSLSSQISALAQDNVEKKYRDFEKMQERCTELQSALRFTDREMEQQEQEIEQLVTHEFDPDCDYCVRNNERLVVRMENLEGKIETHKKNKKLFEDEVNAIQSKMDESIKYDYDEFCSSKDEIQKVEHSLLQKKALFARASSSLSEKKSELNRVKEQIDEYHRSVDIIERNSEIDEQISSLKQDKDTLQMEVKALESRIRGLHGKLQVLQSNKTRTLQSISEMENLEQDLHAYEYYVEAVKRDGIPYELISKVIPLIQSEINNILSQIVDFTITLEVDGKNINGRISYGDNRHWPLEMSSGMERFISSLAIRVALITVSNLPKPNFLIIDEGLGTLSSENLMSMHMLFSILKNQFDFIVIISHLDVVRDMVDGLMEIELDNGYSKINY